MSNLKSWALFGTAVLVVLNTLPFFFSDSFGEHEFFHQVSATIYLIDIVCLVSALPVLRLHNRLQLIKLQAELVSIVITKNIKMATIGTEMSFKCMNSQLFQFMLDPATITAFDLGTDLKLHSENVSKELFQELSREFESLDDEVRPFAQSYLLCLLKIHRGNHPFTHYLLIGQLLLDTLHGRRQIPLPNQFAKFEEYWRTQVTVYQTELALVVFASYRNQRQRGEPSLTTAA